MLDRSFVSFVLVGAVCTGLHYLLLVVLVHATGLAAVPASVIGYVVSTLLSYALNRRKTFASDRAHAEALPRFAAVALAGCMLNAGLLWAMLGLGMHYFPGQLLATLVVLFWNFLANRGWTFAERSAR